MKNILYLIFIFCLMPSLANAQAKPKRDTSKDKSVLAAKKQKEGTERKEVASVERKSNLRKAVVGKRKASYKRKHNVARSYSASYLTVNRQSVSLSSTLSQNGGKMTFDVNTDGKEWTVIGLPHWCKMTRYSNYFLLEYEENIFHDERKDWFFVKCDSKEVCVNLFQPATPYEFAANIGNAYLKHNVYSSSLSCLCLEIHANITIAGAAGEKCSVDAFVVDGKGHSVSAKSDYPSYRLSNSNPSICSSAKIIPSTNKPQSYDVVWFIPNNALDLQKKKNELYCKVMLWHQKKGYLSDSFRLVYFKAKSQKGIVTTESY